MSQAPLCTRSDLGSFGLRAEAIESVSPEIVADTIQARSDWICSYLADRVQLPLVAWDFSIRQACAIAVAWDLTAAPVGRNPEDLTEMDPLYLRFKSIETWLKAIAAGGPLPVITGTPAALPTPTAGAPQIISNRSRGWQDDGHHGGAFSGERRGGR